MQCHEIYNKNIRFDEMKKSSKDKILTRFFVDICNMLILIGSGMWFFVRKC